MPGLSFIETLLVVGVSVDLLRVPDAPETAYRAIVHLDGQDAGGRGDRRSEAIGQALASLGFTDVAGRLLADDSWVKLAAILDDGHDSYMLSLRREQNGAFRVTLSVVTAESVTDGVAVPVAQSSTSAAGDTLLAAMRTVAGDRQIVVPEAFANNQPVPETFVLAEAAAAQAA